MHTHLRDLAKEAAWPDPTGRILSPITGEQQNTKARMSDVSVVISLSEAFATLYDEQKA